MPQNFWTNRRIQILRDCAAAGLSGLETAKRIGHGITREAIMGKASRLGIKFNGFERFGVRQKKRWRAERIVKLKRQLALLRAEIAAERAKSHAGML